jgi:hypothetical protein
VVDAHTFTKQAEKFQKTSACKIADENCFLEQERSADGKCVQRGTIITSEVYRGTLNKRDRPVQIKKCTVQVARASGHGVCLEFYADIQCTHIVVLLHVSIQLLPLDHCWNISTRSCLTTFLTALVSFRVSTTYLPTRITGSEYRDPTVMRGCWKVSKRG